MGLQKIIILISDISHAPGQMAEWLWRVTQAKAFGRYKLSWILIGLSCVGSNPTLFIIILLFVITVAEIRFSFSFCGGAGQMFSGLGKFSEKDNSGRCRD